MRAEEDRFLKTVEGGIQRLGGLLRGMRSE